MVATAIKVPEPSRRALLRRGLISTGAVLAAPLLSTAAVRLAPDAPAETRASFVIADRAAGLNRA